MRALETAVLIGLGLACVRVNRTERSEASLYLALAFGSLGLLALASLGLPEPLTRSLGPADPMAWLIKVLLAVLLVFPYLLSRFLSSLDPTSSGLTRIVGVLSVLAIAALLAIPTIPAATARSRPVAVLVFFGVVVVQWAVASLGLAERLWRAGRGQATVVRRRMHVLSLGALALVATLIPDAMADNGIPTSPAHLADQALAILAALAFYVGFAPPAFLRAAWRRGDQAAFRAAQADLMAALSPAEVAAAVLPHARTLLGAQGAGLVASTGSVIGADGLDPSTVARLAQGLAGRSGPARLAEGLLVIPLSEGTLLITTSPYTPFFGRDEVALVEDLGALTSLALARAELFQRERVARELLEAAHGELEDLVHSFSHDLKSPLVSLLGYLDYLSLDCGEALGTTGAVYVERMKAAASYMSELISDLLELSRIGRTETVAEQVDLERIVAELADGIEAEHPSVSVMVGPLPVVEASPVRMRQLFTNLLDNAVAHGGRDDLSIAVVATPTPGGGAAVTVADDGVGIPEQYRERVFGIFERLEPSRGDRRQGTGIGLAICRKIVEQLGGSITVADAPVGATFRIELPASVVCGWPDPGLGEPAPRPEPGALQDEVGSPAGAAAGRKPDRQAAGRP